MNAIHPFLTYLLFTVGATVCGVFYSMAIENLKEYKYRHIIVATAFVLGSPILAWSFSILVSSGNLLKRFRQSPA